MYQEHTDTSRKKTSAKHRTRIHHSPLESTTNSKPLRRNMSRLSSRTDSLTGVSCRSNGLNMHVTTESAQRTPHVLHSQTTLNQIWPDINRLHKEVLFHIHLLTTAVLQHTLIKITNLGFLWQPVQRLCTVTDGMLLPSLQNITGSSISCRNVRLVTSDGIKRKCNKSQKKAIFTTTNL